MSESPANDTAIGGRATLVDWIAVVFSGFVLFGIALVLLYGLGALLPFIMQ